MWTYSLDPVLVSFWGLDIRWYGIIYAFGFLLALWFILRSREELKLSKDQSYDLLFYIMIGDIIGARLFYVIFWQPAYYFANPLEILFLWHGGLAFHGGLVGVVLAAWLYCRKNKIAFLKVADVLSIPALIGLGLGRIANFINGELVGRVTNVSWCVNFGDGLCRHPYVLYSAVKRFALAGVLYWMKKSFVLADGFLFWTMLFLLGVGRFFLDFVREDILYYGLSVGQWMSLTMVLLALVILLKNYKEDLRKVFK
ncbi:prolipoprotein diacylglyceryl transferase [Candidatus Woesearchaeota archaeon]|nr:prolipoprotein diacylglyceryl transferase [Candidatus Woesearchaeota archaeon]